MFKRKVDLILSEWKSKKNKHPLIISGARQIGKTTSIEEFGKTYSSFVEINFVANPQYKTIFLLMGMMWILLLEKLIYLITN